MNVSRKTDHQMTPTLRSSKLSKLKLFCCRGGSHSYAEGKGGFGSFKAQFSHCWYIWHAFTHLCMQLTILFTVPMVAGTRGRLPQSMICVHQTMTSSPSDSLRVNSTTQKEPGRGTDLNEPPHFAGAH